MPARGRLPPSLPIASGPGAVDHRRCGASDAANRRAFRDTSGRLPAPVEMVSDYDVVFGQRYRGGAVVRDDDDDGKADFADHTALSGEPDTRAPHVFFTPGNSAPQRIFSIGSLSCSVLPLTGTKRPSRHRGRELRCDSRCWESTSSLPKAAAIWPAHSVSGRAARSLFAPMGSWPGGQIHRLATARITSLQYCVGWAVAPAPIRRHG